MPHMSINPYQKSKELLSPEGLREAARAALGGIDLDPASSPEMNAYIRATAYYERCINRFPEPWRGRVFLNPPSGFCDDDGWPIFPRCTRNGSCGRPLGHVHSGEHCADQHWWSKLLCEYWAQRVTAAVFVATNVDLPFATQGNAPWCRFTDYPVCVPSPRLGFLEEVRGRITWGGLTHASVIAFLPEHGRYAESLQRFRSAFASLGAVTIPSWWMTEPTA